MVQLSIVVGVVEVVGWVAGVVEVVWMGGGLGETGRGLLRDWFCFGSSFEVGVLVVLPKLFNCMNEKHVKK